MCGNCMLGWGMDVPACEVEGGVVVCEAGQAGVVVFFVGEGESGTEAPVVEVTFEVAAVIESRLARQGWAVL